MLGKLRKRFIRTAMASVLIVLVVILVAINCINYRNYIRESDARLDMIERADGNLSGMREARKPTQASGNAAGSTSDGNTPADGNPPQKPPGDAQMAEAPYDTRYFSAELDEDKEIISTNMTDIASITQSEAERMIKMAVSGSRSAGTMGSFRYRISREDNDHYLIIFLNVSSSKGSFDSFLQASIIVGVIGVVAIFILMHFLTRLAMAPAKEAFEKQKQFITDASHEIKTPLAIIESNAEVLGMEDESNKWIANIKNQVTRLSGLTEKLVMLSRMDEAGYRSPLSSFDLAELVRKTAGEYEGYQIIIDAPDYLPYYGSRENIGKLLSMLLDNAEKYSTGEISVSLTGAARTYNKIKRHGYTLLISNPCTEIRQGDLDALFERFSRLDSSRSNRTGGSGIGLAVVNEIVKYHKGEAHAYSEDGHTFTVEIRL